MNNSASQPSKSEASPQLPDKQKHPSIYNKVEETIRNKIVRKEDIEYKNFSNITTKAIKKHNT